ncbi:MAG TPA: hypothetical protein VMM79_07020 [Longimicrobiales bacterium]|nr:hypothetical protein [Longimicrobiales bacterium]
MKHSIARMAAIAVAGIVLLAATPADAVRWGRDGHQMVGTAAANGLPEDMPRFFRDASEQLAWLNYDPDRWRNDGMIEANEAWQYDHFIDLEPIPDAALAERNRFEYLLWLQRAGVTDPESLGLLPFRVVELTQRLTQGFSLWRRESDPLVRGWLEQRIINDAGILGHYVADGANPHHSTIHYNGWATGSPNPAGYTSDRTFHRRFESDFVSAKIELSAVVERSTAPARVLTDLRTDVIAYVRRSNALVRRLYDLEKAEQFSAATTSTEHAQFAIERLVAGADMLRSVWYTAWMNSSAD